MKITNMEILRNSLFDELSRLKSGDTTPDDSNAVVKVANSIINTYNTELKAISCLMEAEERGFKSKGLEIFSDTELEPSKIKSIIKRSDDDNI